MSVIIDRRLNDRNKSATNRARFMRRYKKHIRRAVTDMVAERSITDMEQGGTVDIPTRDVAEPQIRHGNGGDRDIVLPGNKEFNPGDRLQRPSGGSGGGGDGEGGEGGDSNDAFAFTLSREEFMSIFFDDLELPHLMRTNVGSIQELKPQRAGFSADGSPANLSVERTMRQALARRIALTGEARRRLAALQAQVINGQVNAFQSEDSAEDDATEVEAYEEETRREETGCDVVNRDAVAEEIVALKRRIKRVPFLDEVDLRYRNRIMVPRPMSQAVMFCLMDVSASMDEQRKDLAKRFYTLLYLFLSRKYERVEIVFIRHTSNAEEVDEERFFHDRQSGGTVVLSALQLMHEIIYERFPRNEWNIYGAQASDGDAFGADPEKSRGFLGEQLLPLLRHFSYIEVGDQYSRQSTTLSAAYSRIDSECFAMVRVKQHSDIYPVFRELFTKKPQGLVA